ncbi:MAG TPA: cobaltochelatase subunit CobN [Blastocatellia bacterium]|nr:cobaltochelatase subunit CobN [Blastocatellia bacterium]
MKITVFYVGTSLLAPLRRAEDEINARHRVGLQVATYNCGAPLTEAEWRAAESDVGGSNLVFVIHVTEGENAARIAAALECHQQRHNAVIAFNCMPDLMRRTRMGKLDFGKLMKPRGSRDQAGAETSASSIAKKLGTWMSDFVKGRTSTRGGDAPNRGGPPARADQYVKLIGRLPAILKFVPGAGKLGDIKNYLLLFGYFLQPTPNNIRAMLLFAIKHYAPGDYHSIRVDPAETMPVVGVYHPDAPNLFETFEAYQKWYQRKRRRTLDRDQTIGLLLMRPQIISDARRHYDGLIRAIEDEGLSVIPAISTFMDNREAGRKCFVEEKAKKKAAPRKGVPPRAPLDGEQSARGIKRGAHGRAPLQHLRTKSRVSQVVSLTGFSFVGGPAMNDSQAAAEFLKELNVPFRSMVSLDVQTIEHWKQSKLGLNAIQAAMQIAIPEIDGATEPFVFGGLPANGNQPEPLEERCRRIARRLARWNRLRVAPRDELRLALLVFCFPPNKGNIGTAADLDVFPSLWGILSRLKSEGYAVDVPDSPEQLREMLLEGNSGESGMLANVAYRMSVEEYRSLCPYVDDIEREWGRAPGAINSNGREILVLGIQLGKVFVGVQPTFGYEGDPMRLLAAESGAPHHGFMGLYTYLEKIFRADAVVHVGTHGAMEFMPGKQVGLSESCWPDRLIGELPNVYIYSVNNPSEGTIAKRRSYAELVSYLTPPIENAGLYKEFVSMKELLTAFRLAEGEAERHRLFEAIEDKAQQLNL